MNLPARARVTLIAGVALTTLLPPGGDLPFRWILWPAAICGIVGAILALRSSADAGLRFAGLGLLILGWFLRIHAGSEVDGMPAEPALGRWFDLNPVLGAALVGGGIFVWVHDGEVTTARRVVGLGAILLLAAGLYPQTPPGSVTIPLLASAQASWMGFLLAAGLTGGGALVAWVVLRPQRLSRSLALVIPAIVPVWLLLKLDGRAALLSAGEEISIASALVLFAAAPMRDASSRRRVALVAEAMVLLLIAAIWCLLKIHGLGYAAMDEYIYFYAGNAWAHGLWPYRDFFFAHPPIHIAIPALVFLVTGFHHLIAKLIAPVALFIAGAVLWRTARRPFGRVAAVAALILFWFGNEVLVASTSFTGVELTTLFLVLGISAALDRRSFTAGLWFGVSACTGVYGVAGFLTFVVLAAFAPRRDQKSRFPGDQFDAVRMAAGFLLVFLGVNLTFYAIGGSRYWDGVYRYHFLKAMKNPEQHSLTEDPLALLSNLGVLFRTTDFLTDLYMHGAQYWFALVAIGLLARRQMRSGSLGGPRTWWPARPGEAKPDGAVILLWLSFAGTLTELASLNERFPFYFTIVFPTLSLIGGFVVGEVVSLVDEALRSTPEPVPSPTQGRRSREKKPLPSEEKGGPNGRRWVFALIALASLTLWVPLDSWANAAAFPDEYGKGMGELVQFHWTPSPVLPALGEVAHALVWKDTRVRGVIQPSIRHFLWTKKHTFETAPEIAEYVAAHTSPEDTITGASDFVPLIALLSHRRLSGNQIDTNSKVFSTGIVPEEEFWHAVCSDRPAYIVATASSHFAPATFPNRPRIVDAFHFDRTFDDPGLKLGKTLPIELWRRTREPPDAICAQ